jgi:hypothetical protein
MMTEEHPGAASVDTSRPHPARRYDYWLGGKDNFAADRESGDLVAAAFPTIRDSAVQNRRFLRRAVTFLAGERGVHQFLDIGTGLPTADNTHQVAQAIAPDSRIVYVDNDPIVLCHARALLTSAPEGATAYLDADLRDPDRILSDPVLHRTLDLTEPVGLMLVAILHFLGDDDDPYQVVARLVAAMPAGSFLVASHATTDPLPAEVAVRLGAASAASGIDVRFRDRGEFGRFFGGLELVDPGVVSVTDWRVQDDPSPRPSAAQTGVYGAVARIPARPPVPGVVVPGRPARFVGGRRLGAAVVG